MDIIRGIIGIVFLLGVAFLLSRDRKAINWKLVGAGLLFQLVLALFILKVPGVGGFFELVSKAFVKVINFTDAGTTFLMDSFADDLGPVIPTELMNFAFNILPKIVFFSALTAFLYYIGLLQKFVYAFAWIMKKTLGLSGAESLSAAGNIFLGQTESPLLVKPYLEKMTKSELNCLMTGGMATIAGSVLALYVQWLGDNDPVLMVYYAKHLLSASIMSAPAAVVAAKMLFPEKEKINQDMQINKEKLGANVLEAITVGTTDGVKLAVNVGAMLLVFTAFIAFGNYILGDFIGRFTGLNDWIETHTIFDKLSMQCILGYLLAPIAWLIGTPSEDIVYVGQLLGEKTVLNELIAYSSLTNMKNTGVMVHEKSIIIATYALCGFANFASIGIQIGGIGVLAPTRRGQLAKLGVLALVGGTIACFMTASIVGMFF